MNLLKYKKETKPTKRALNVLDSKYSNLLIKYLNQKYPNFNLKSNSQSSLFLQIDQFYIRSSRQSLLDATLNSALENTPKIVHSYIIAIVIEILTRLKTFSLNYQADFEYLVLKVTSLT